MGHIENGKWFVAADGRSAGLTEPDPYSQFCLACGYALAELDKNYCPECGSAFDPHDDNTFRNDSPATRKAIERYRRRATASWLLALTFLVSFLYLLTFADSLQPRIGAHGLIGLLGIASMQIPIGFLLGLTALSAGCRLQSWRVIVPASIGLVAHAAVSLMIVPEVNL